jgi:hypothetical protein
MWSNTEITVEIHEVDHPVMIVTITVPIGVLEVIGNVTLVGRTLRIDGAHDQGLLPGALGRAGLNAIGRKLLEEADVDEIVIQGGTRTTGQRKGKVPRPIRFPTHQADPAR